MTRIALVLVVALTASSCCVLALRAPHDLTCPDGLPVKLLQARDCPRGVCGYSCQPGRWD